MRHTDNPLVRSSRAGNSTVVSVDHGKWKRRDGHRLAIQHGDKEYKEETDLYGRWTHCAMQAQSWQTRATSCLSGPLLKGKAALCFHSKPFSLQFLDKRRAVDLKQLGGFTGNPVGSAKRSDDETMLELLEFS